MSVHKNNDWAQLLKSFIIPESLHYKDIRPHQLVLAGALWKTFQSTSIYRKFADTVLKHLSSAAEVIGVPLVMMGLVPDALIRYGIRIQLRDRLASLRQEDVESEGEAKMKIVQELHTLPIAIETDKANDQHYEVPAKFYDLSLGPCKKYSSGLWYVFCLLFLWWFCFWACFDVHIAVVA